MSEELEHSLRGPSGASGWRRCHGKINAERGLPDKAGRDAAQGTVFHEYAAMCLIYGLDPEDFPLGVIHEQDGHKIEFDEDMVRYMHEGLDWVRSNIEPGDVVFIEKRVDISPWAGDDEFGTSDVYIIKFAKKKLIVFDWKYGKGVAVSPVKNDQQYLYTLGGWNTFDLETLFFGVEPKDIEVEFYIEQPRMAGGGGSWTTNMADVLAEGELIKEDALATMDPFAPRTPGEKQCTFCRAAGQCGPQAKWLLETYGQKFEDVQEAAALGVGPAFEDPNELDPMVRNFMLLHWKAFKRFVDKAHAIVLHEMQAGKDNPLLKAVEGKPGRRFYRPDVLEEAKAELIELVGEDKAFEAKMISPAVGEKIVGKKVWKAKMGAYTDQPKPKPILVGLDDKRKPIQDFASKYADLDDEEETDEDEEETE